MAIAQRRALRYFLWGRAVALNQLLLTAPQADGDAVLL